MNEITKLDEQKRDLLERNKNISDEQLLQDIIDTRQEIQDYQDEKEVLMRNPVENKTKIYLLEGRISPRQNFLEKIEALLELRKSI